MNLIKFFSLETNNWLDLCVNLKDYLSLDSSCGTGDCRKYTIVFTHHTIDYLRNITKVVINHPFTPGPYFRTSKVNGEMRTNRVTGTRD